MMPRAKIMGGPVARKGDEKWRREASFRRGKLYFKGATTSGTSGCAVLSHLFYVRAKYKLLRSPMRIVIFVTL